MRTLSTRPLRRRECGSAAVEMAFVLPILLLFLAVPLFAARIFWYYSVAEKAAHDGARFLSTATQAEIKDAASGAKKPPVVVLAESISDTELDEIKAKLAYKHAEAQCDYKACGGSVPQTVRMTVEIHIKDDILGSLSSDYLYFGPDGLTLIADVTMRYAGN